MSSPNIGSVDLSTSPNNQSAAAAAAALARKRQQGGQAPVYSPAETLNQMTQEAEQRHQDKYVVQKEMRAIRAREMEKQRIEDEEREKVDGESSSRFNRPSISVSAASSSNGHSLPPTSSLPPTKQRIYSTNRLESESTSTTSTTQNEDNPRELKKKIAEMEEKFKKHAIYQTQLENDNQKLIYELDLLKDLIEEHQELIIELRRQFKEKARELDCQKRTNKDLQTDFSRLKDILKQRDALIEDSGLVLYTDYESNVKQSSNTPSQANLKKPPTSKGATPNNSDTPLSEMRSVLPAVLVAPETAKLLDQLGEGTIDEKLRRVFAEKLELKELNAKLNGELEDERDKRCELEKKLIAQAHKVLDSQESNQELQDIQRQYTKEINELKMKIQKLDHENIIIKQDKQRLDTQLKYLQTNFDELENTERRLIKEKRDAQRELNESKMLVSDLQLKIEVLQKTLEKKRQTPKYIDTSSTTSTTTTAVNSSSSYASTSSTSLNSLSSTSLLTTGGGNATTSSAATLTPAINNNGPSTPPSSNSQNSSRKSSISTNLIDENGKSTAASAATASTTVNATTTESSSSPTISSNSSSSSSSPSSSSNNHNHHNDIIDDLTTTTPTKTTPDLVYIERDIEPQ